MTTKRVVVWGTGFVGKLVIPEILPHPEFELVGVGVSNPDKVGQDVGTLCGIQPIGIEATDDLDALVALQPDALVHYGPTAALASWRASTTCMPSHGTIRWTTSATSVRSFAPASTCAPPR